LTVEKKLNINDNSSGQYKLYESLLRRQKKIKQKTVYNTLDTPVQDKTIDKVILFSLCFFWWLIFIIVKIIETLLVFLNKMSI